jgi:lysozyme
MKTISQNCVDLVKHFEGLFLKAYKCPAGVWTIGWGHTGLRHNDGTVRAGRVITKAQAEELLKLDLVEKYAPMVRRLVKAPVNQAQFDALVSFHFNTGKLGASTLLKRLNAEDYAGAAEQFMRWTKARDPKTGQRVELRGLVRRRRAERALFLGGDWRAAAVTW